MALMRTINESSFRDLVESGQMSERELAYVEPKFGQGDAAKAKRAREAERAEAAKVSIACQVVMQAQDTHYAPLSHD